jgi:Glycosyl hydrolases family 15
LDWRVAWTRASVAVGAAGLAALTLLSGGTRADPRTPAALPGLPPPFLGAAVVGDGGRTEAVDAYGDVVGRWAAGPAGRPLIHNPAARQLAGSVPPDTGIVARMPGPGGRGSVPLWQADSVEQRYLPGANALRTVARLRGAKTVIVRSIGGPGAARADRRWLARARPLGAEAPRWARAMYRRSLLVLRALTDRRTGAVAAGPREGWAYVWPRDASAVAMAFASAGYRREAGRVVRFLLGLDLGAAARFRGTGEPVPGRGPQGDAAGWVAAAARAAGGPAPRLVYAWRDRADYQEGESGDYLANAIASTADGPKTGAYRGKSARRREVAKIAAVFGAAGGLVRRAGGPGPGLDSAAAWAVRPFRLHALFPLAQRTLLRLAAGAGRYGIVPSEGWAGGEDPWTAPTAWSAWSLAALASAEPRRFRGTALRDRRAALHLIGDLRRAATPAGLLPERVDARTGVPTSTTPLAWSHAFAILALRELWPGKAWVGR